MMCATTGEKCDASAFNFWISKSVGFFFCSFSALVNLVSASPDLCCKSMKFKCMNSYTYVGDLSVHQLAINVSSHGVKREKKFEEYNPGTESLNVGMTSTTVTREKKSISKQRTTDTKSFTIHNWLLSLVLRVCTSFHVRLVLIFAICT